MKKKYILTTSLCALLLGGSLGGALVACAEALNSYPADFAVSVTFSELKDYAIDGDEYLFLDGDSLMKLGNGRYEKIDCDGKNVTGVGYASNAFYYFADNNCYYLDGEPCDTYTADAKNFTIDDYYYYINNSGNVSVLDTKTDKVTSLDGFANLKEYKKAYAVKENVLYELNGAEYTACPLEYFDYSETLNIAVGNTAEKLKTNNIDAPHFVRLKSGSYMTEIEAEALGDTFTAGKTVKVGKEVTADTALLLCNTGSDDSIAVVMVVNSDSEGKVKSQCYLMRSDNTTAITRNAMSQEADKPHATATVSNGYIYSSPYVCGITQLKEIKAGDKFDILGTAKKQINPELARDFYLVKFTDENGLETTGYVPLEYVSLFRYDAEKDPEKTVDPGYSEEDNVKTVVLVIIVIALVLIALGYMVFVGTGKKKDKDNTEKKDKKDKKKKKDKKN